MSWQKCFEFTWSADQDFIYLLKPRNCWLNDVFVSKHSIQIRHSSASAFFNHNKKIIPFFTTHCTLIYIIYTSFSWASHTYVGATVKSIFQVSENYYFCLVRAQFISHTADYFRTKLVRPPNVLHFKPSRPLLFFGQCLVVSWHRCRTADYVVDGCLAVSQLFLEQVFTHLKIFIFKHLKTFLCVDFLSCHVYNNY